MNRKLFFTTFLMLLCSLGFGQHWTMDNVQYQNNMLVVGVVQIDGIEQTNADIELAAFHNGVLRGVSKPYMLTADGKTRYVFQHTIHGNTDGELLNFKIYVPGNGENQGKEYTTDYTTLFSANGEIWGDYNTYEPLAINFYERHWSSDVTYENNMTIGCTIIIDGEIQERTDLEMAAFCENGEVRGVAKPVYWAGPNIYFTSLIISGNNNERIDFKVYDPIQGKEISTEYYVTFVNDAMIGEDAPLSIEFITTPYVAQVGDKKYQSLEKALKALTDGSTLTILEDITISEKWDNRYTGAKVGVPVTIDGNGKTIKFTGEINDGANYTAAFRFENAVTIKNLKIDMSEAISGFPQRLSAVAAKLDITVDACTFLGNANYNNTKAIIFGEGAGSALADVNVSITNSHFENWKYGVSDNQNAQDAKNVTIAKNVFQNASVNVSASEFVMFDENKLDNGNVTITSYTNNTALKVEAIKNTLDATKENSIKVDPTDNINAQEGFLLPVAKIGSKYYLELDKAIAAAKACDVVTVFAGTYDLPSMKAGITVEGQGEVMFTGYLTGTLENLTIKNIHIKGGNAQRWAYAKGNLVFENVTFEATSVYALHFDGITEGATLLYKDCTIIGWAAMSGSPESCTFDGCTFIGNGTYGLIRTYFDATIKNCTFDVANVNTTDQYQDGIHAVSGAYVTVNNSTNVNGYMEDIVNVHALSIVNLDGVEIKNVAKIGDNYYLTLQAAVNAVEESATITMVADTKLAEKVVVPTGKAITLDLNNKTISQEKACTASYEMILNKGNLTITGEGVISFKDTSAGDPTFGWGSYTVRNEGTLVVENGTIEHLGEQEAHMICAIFQYSGSSTINGGTISTPNYRSARLWSGDMTINGGEFDGQLWLQAVNNTSKLTINGGTFTPNGGDASSIFVTNSQYDVVFAVTDGTFNGKIGCSNATKLAGCITGGTFSATAKENTASDLIAMGYIFKEADVNGYYEVVDDPTTLYITNLEELKAFREAVNDDNTFAGITVYLAADIDLANEEWAPIGSDKNHAFKGTFDGQEYTISNLKIEDNDLDCAGLFGYATNATIKNVNVKNVDIEAYSHVAPIAGHMYTGNIENCHVSGTINLVAQYAYAAGITADGYVNVRNCSVIADDTGVITVVEKTGAGGITGWRGEGNLVIKNCTVKNLDITAWASLGGITGIAQYNNVITGCTVENVNLTKTRENGQASVGLVSGNWTNKADDNYTITMTNNHFDNMSINGTAITSLYLLYGSNYSYYDKVIKLVDEGNTYGTITTDFKVVVKTLAELKNALAYVKAGETIELGADIEATEVLMIGKSLTINGNDYSVSSNANRVFRVTTSNTEVTLNNVDMVSNAVRVGQNDIRGISIDASLSNVQMTLNDCSVDFTDVSANDWTYAVNVSGNGKDHKITVNDGKYEGANVINAHGASNTIVVKDATLTSLYPNNDEYYGACIWVLQNQDSSVEATGNTFNGSNAVAFNLGTGTTLTESNNTDNTTICVAKIGNEYYTSLAAAFEAAEDGNTIKVLHDIALAESITNVKTITLDLNGKTITGTDNATASFGLFTNRGELTIEGNGTITLVATNNRGWNAYSSVISNTVGGKLIVENGTIEHLGGTDMAYGIDNLTNGKGTYAETVVNGGTVKSTYRAIRQFLNGVEAQNILTVNGGTIEGANKSIWMQDPSKNANTGTLTVGENAELKGDVYLFVTAGSTEWPVEVSIANAAFAAGSTVVTGNVPATYVVENNNGIWGIVDAVASVNGVGYKTIAEAINAAEIGDEVFVYEGDYTLNISLNKAIVLVGERDNDNNNLVNITGQVSISSNATVKNLNVHNDNNGDYSCAMSVNGENIVIDGVNLSGYNAMRYCYAKGDITIKNSTLNSNNFTIHFDGSNGGNVIIEDSDITGWCSYAGSIGTVSYTNCNIDNGNYSGHRYYNKDINFTECTFSEGMMIDLKSKPSNVAFVDEDMTMDEVKSLFKADQIFNNVVTLNGNKVEYAVSMAGVYYNTLQEAIDALPEGSTATYYGYLKSNNILVAPVTIPSGKKINLSLNNFNITYTSEVANEAMITNNGELTIEGKGNVVYTYIGTPDASYSKGNYTISNSGKLTINGDNTVIENATEAMSHAFYTIQNGNNGTVIINKGEIINTNNYAIRQFASSNNVNTVTINGGKVSGTRAVWIQAPGNNANNKPTISLNVNGGELIGTGESDQYKLAVYSYSYGDSMENISINITNGTIDGDIALTGGSNKTKAETVAIDGGIFNGDVYSYAADEISIPAIAIRGGTFADDYSELYSKDDGYIFVQNAEGTYNVVLALVEIEGEGYESLQAAIDAATEGATIKVVRDFALAETATIPAGKVVTLDLAGYTISQVKEQTAGYQMILNDGTLTIEDSSDDKSGKISYTDSGNGGEYISDVIYNRATLIINGGTIENLSSATVAANGYPHAVDTYSGIRNASVTINGGTIYCAEYSAVRMFCVSENNTADLTINGGTINGSIDMQNGIVAAAKGSLRINDGNFATTKNANNIRFANWNGGATGYGIVASIEGGIFNGNISTQYVPAQAGFNSKFITGGAFVNNPSDYCAENYGAVYNGEYFIVKLISGTQTREFASAGWYWFSTYIDLEGTDGLEALQYTLGENAKQIKGQEGFTQYYKAYQAWSPGGLTAISTAKMYMINTTDPVTVELTGDFVDYEERDITLNPGWNWIGYPVRDTVNVKDALAKLTPSNGDVIKSKDVTYTYLWGNWQGNGNLKMTPGMGYMYQSNANNVKTFRYSTNVTNNSRSENTVEEYHWIADASKYPSNMTVIAMLNIDGEAAGDNYEVAAFANGECRGSARPFYIGEIDSYVLIMTIQGEEVEELTFMCYDVNYGTEYELSNRVNYSSDAILGSIEEPYMFNMNFLNIEESSLDMINIYPNPTTTDRAINLQATCDNVEVFNALGVKVAEYQNVDTIDALETAGVYVIRVTINGEVKNCRLVVK